MCGIAGFIDFKKETSQNVLTAMTDMLTHRGPDDSGYEIYDSQKASIGFGHRRLSIIDLSEHGHQPMHFGDWSIVFNGEIYNFEEIRQELEKDFAVTFSSHSDTEVIIQAFDKWGISCVSKLNGMFAFVIFNKKTNIVYGVRDRAGVKPLYYYHKDDIFLFSSEIKSFHKHPEFEKQIDDKVLGLYFQYGYIPAPYSIFTNVKKVLPGAYLHFDLSENKLKEEVYWDVIHAYNEPKLDISLSDAVEKTEELLKSSFKYRLISDVPVGIFLSGGYDSATVTAILQKEHTEPLKTFTIGFTDQQYDEAPYGKQVAKFLGTQHHEYYCTEKEALDIVKTLPDIYDEPFADSSAIPTILVSRMASKEVTVVLSADGGDEIFAGYSRYSSYLANYYRLSKLPQIGRSMISLAAPFNLGKVLKKLGIIKSSFNYNKLIEILKGKILISRVNKISSQKIPTKDLYKVLKKKVEVPATFFDEEKRLNEKNDPLSKILAIDYKTYMVDDILTKVDRATMSVSIEAREPLLDYRLIEFAAKLPSSFKMSGPSKKIILKEIAHKYLPKDLMDRPKMGFGIPLAKWLRNDLKDLVLEYLEEERIDQQGIFNSKELKKIKVDFFNGDNDAGEFIWHMLMFQMWYSKWM